MGDLDFEISQSDIDKRITNAVEQSNYVISRQVNNIDEILKNRMNEIDKILDHKINKINSMVIKWILLCGLIILILGLTIFNKNGIYILILGIILILT